MKLENEYFEHKITDALISISEKVKADAKKIDLNNIEIAEKILNSGNSELINANADLLYYAFMNPLINENQNDISNYPLVSDINYDYFIDANCQATNNLYSLHNEEKNTLKANGKIFADVKLTYHDLLKQGRTPKEYEINGIDLYIMDAIISLYASRENVTHISINQICKILMNKKGKLKKSDLKVKEIKWSIIKLTHTYLNYNPTLQERETYKDAFKEIDNYLEENVPLLTLNDAKMRTRNNEIVNGYHIIETPLLFALAKVYNQNISAKKFLELNPKCTSIGERALLFYLYKRVEIMKNCSRDIKLETLNNIIPVRTPRKIREKAKEYLQELKQNGLISDFKENKVKQSGKIISYTFYPIGYRDYTNKTEVSNER